MKPQAPADVAADVRQHLIGSHAGNRDAEMMERALEALYFTGDADGLDTILVRDQGRKGKTARSVLWRSTFVKSAQPEHSLRG